jgi:hypothetical protein
MTIAPSKSSRNCIPDDIPCDDGYVMNPDYPECRRTEYVRKEHQTIDECWTEHTNPKNISSRLLK